MEIRGLERLLIGNEDEPPPEREEKGQVLTSYGVSSLVTDRLCDQARGRKVAVACFYFDFAAQKEQSPASMLGALLNRS